MRSDVSNPLEDEVQGLALSGGGSRASFEIGALRYLYDVERIAPQVVTGTSAGAILATVLAQASDGDAQRQHLSTLEGIWRGMRTTADLYEEEPWFTTLRRFAPALADVFDRLHSRHDPGSGAAALWGPYRMVETLLAMRRLSLHSPEVEAALTDAEHAQSLYRPGRVADHLRRAGVLDEALVAGSGTRLRVAVVDLESGALRYVTEAGRIVDREDRPLPGTQRVALADAVRASCAVPAVFAPVALAGHHYIDGGTREMLPVEVAVRHLGVRRCYAVVANAPVAASDLAFGTAGLLSLLLRSQTEIVVDELLRDELELARPYADVTVIAPEFDVHDPLMVEPGLIAIAMDYGHLRAADVVTRAGADQEELTRQIVGSRVALWAADRPASARSGGVAPGYWSRVPQTAARTLVDDPGDVEQRLRRLVSAKPRASLPPDTGSWFGRTSSAPA